MRRLLLTRRSTSALLHGVGLVGVVGCLLGWLLAAPAAAHGDLAAGSPGPGDTVGPGGTVVQLEFEVLDLERQALVAVLGPDDEPIPVGQASIEQGVLVCARSAALEPGVHTIEYSVSATDGHLLTGRYSFEVSPSGDPAPSTDCDESELAAPEEAQTVLEMTNEGLPGWLIPSLVGVTVLAVGGVILRIRRDRRASKGPSSD